jgi:hypothetical protein
MKCAAAKVVSFAGIVCTMSVDFSAGPLFCIMTRACDFDILDTRAYRIVSRINDFSRDLSAYD